MFDEPDTRGKTIRGDQLMHSYLFLEKYASSIALGKEFAIPIKFLNRGIERFRSYRPKDRPFWWETQWIGQAARSAHTRTMLEDCNEMQRAEMIFVIPVVVKQTVLDANPPELGTRSLDADNKNVLHYLLEMFLEAVASGEIPERTLKAASMPT
jgi:hypothetical protein